MHYTQYSLPLSGIRIELFKFQLSKCKHLANLNRPVTCTNTHHGVHFISSLRIHA